MTRKRSTDIEVIDPERYLLSSGFMRDFLKETLGPDEKITEGDLPRIRLPGLGGTTWEQPNGNPVKVLEGIIIHRQVVRAWWGAVYTGESNPPDCSSPSGPNCIGHWHYEGQACATCPMSQQGSGNAETMSQACRVITRLYMLFPASVLPTMLRLPPSSFKFCKQYVLNDLPALGFPAYHRVETSIGLRQEKNAGGILYSVATFEPLRVVGPEALEALEAYRQAILPLLKALPVTAAED